MALYWPIEWPAWKAGEADARSRLGRQVALEGACAATEAASSAGCALTVRSSSSAGPSQASARDGLAEGLVGLLPDGPAAAEDASASARPMPTDCEPWPG